MNTDPIPSEVRERVASGARLLDEKRPAWFRTAFAWENFNINSTSHCILGQIFRNEPNLACSAYDRGVKAVLDGDYSEVGRLGFTSGGFESWVLKDAWMDEVQKRLDRNVQPESENPKRTLELNETETALLLDLLAKHQQELDEEIGKLKPQYRRFLAAPKMTAHALITALATDA